MKYLKTFESSFGQINTEILSTIDSLTSFVEDLSSLGFTEGYGKTKRPIQAYARIGGQHSQRFTLEQFAKYVSDNIDKDIHTIEWGLNGECQNVDDRELDLVVESFMGRLKEFASTCRVNNFSKVIEKKTSVQYIRGEHVVENTAHAKINLSMLDSKSNRYKHLFTKDEAPKDI